MEKKITKEERKKEKAAISDAVTGKMATVFAALVAAIIALVYFGERFIPPMSAIIAAQVSVAVLTVLALVWFSLSLNNKKDYRFKIFSPAFVFGLASAALLIVLMYPLVDASRTIITAIALSVLFFVYEIYPIDFFLCSVAIISGCISATIVNNQGVTLFKDLIVLILYAAVMAICIGVLVKLVKYGKFKLGTKTVKKPFGMLLAPACVSIAASLAVVIGVLALGGYLMYLVASACVIYFVIAIIYTVKLM